MKKITDLKRPQKQKYRIFAWKIEEKPFECYESDEYNDILYQLIYWLRTERDFNLTIDKKIYEPTNAKIGG